MTAQGRVDRETAKAAALNYAILLLILRPMEPMREVEFDAVAIAVAVVLARAERRAAGER